MIGAGVTRDAAQIHDINRMLGLFRQVVVGVHQQCVADLVLHERQLPVHQHHLRVLLKTDFLWAEGTLSPCGAVGVCDTDKEARPDLCWPTSTDPYCAHVD